VPQTDRRGHQNRIGYRYRQAEKTILALHGRDYEVFFSGGGPTLKGHPKEHYAYDSTLPVLYPTFAFYGPWCYLQGLSCAERGQKKVLEWECRVSIPVIDEFQYSHWTGACCLFLSLSMKIPSHGV
jgi:hypothetical protein